MMRVRPANTLGFILYCALLCRYSLHGFQILSPRPSTLTARFAAEELYESIHRKEYEIKQLKAQHTKPSDPINMAVGYGQETASPMRLAKALRRVYEDPYNAANPNRIDKPTGARDKKLAEIGMQELGMRRASCIVDIKRESNGEQLCTFDDAGMVAAAMVGLGADAVFVNTDFHSYGGDISELSSAVRAVRKVSDTAAVVMKDIVVDEIQLGLAKDAGADGIVLMASVLGGALENFLDLSTSIGLEVVVECHTKAEVERALEILAPNILVNNYDRATQRLYPDQAVQLAGLFPGSGGPIICLATGRIETIEDMKRHLNVGYDGVVLGRAMMGNTQAPEFIRGVRDRTMLPAEMSSWGIDAEFDPDGNLVEPPAPPTSRTDTATSGGFE